MNRLHKLRSYGFAETDTEVWFPNIYFNALIRLNKQTGRIQIIGKFPDYNIRDEWLYSTVCEVAGKLVFVPCNSGEIAVYDITAKKFSVIALEKDRLGEERPYFLSAYVHNQYIYMFPARAKHIVRYNTLEETVTYIDNGLKNLTNSLPKAAVCFCWQYDVLDKKIFMPYADVNAVAVFNTNGFDNIEDSFDTKYLDIKGGCSTINYAQGYFYLAAWKEPKIYRWNIKTGQIKTYKDFPEGFIGGDYLFSHTCRLENKLFYFPHAANMIVSLDIKTGEIREEKRVNKWEEKTVHTFFVKGGREKCCILTADMEYAGVFYYEDEQMKWSQGCLMDAAFNKKQIHKFLLEQGYYKNYIEEEGVLKEYLDVLRDAGQSEDLGKEERCGKLIWDKIQ